MNRLIFTITLLAAVCVLSACSTPSAVPTVTDIPPQTQEPASTSTPEPTLTLTFTPEPTLTPTLAPGDTAVRQADGMVMVYVPEGEFIMGASATVGQDICYQFFQVCPLLDEYLDEDPEHTVYVDAFWIDQTEVTYTQYLRCLEAGACRMTESQVTHCFEFGNCGFPENPDDLTGFLKPELGEGIVYRDDETIDTGLYIKAENENRPVVDVSWQDALAYCEWVGGRLPTEAEWEKAARGTDGRIFPWGNTDLEVGMVNFDNRISRSTEVGSYPNDSSPYGVLDMAGNVSEWVADYYAEDYYNQSPYENPAGPESSDYRVLRGGSWFDLADGVRLSNRVRNREQNYDLIYGFRCAGDLVP